MQEHLKLLKDLTVLIVEDDEIARELLIGGLKPYCLSVWGAADGLEGLERFKKLAPRRRHHRHPHARDERL